MKPPTAAEVRRECQRLRLPDDDEHVSVLQARFAAMAEATLRLSRLADECDPVVEFAIPERA